MATNYVDPNTISDPATGTVAPATWGDCVRDDLNLFSDPPRAYVTNSTNISFTDSTLTAITWNTESWDSDTMHSTSVNTSRFTCVTAGRYKIDCRTFWSVNATGYRVLELWKNGTSGTFIDADTETTPGSATYPSLLVSGEVSLAVSDYVEAFAWQNSGGALLMRAGSGSYQSWFRARMISQ